MVVLLSVLLSQGGGGLETEFEAPGVDTSLELPRQTIWTLDGTRYEGRVVEEDEKSVHFRTEDALYVFGKNNILKIEGYEFIEGYELEGELHGVQYGPPDSGMVQVLTTVDGSRYFGKVTEVREGELSFETDVGTLIIAFGKIKELKEVPAESFVKREYWPPDPNSTRLLFAPTAYALKQGEMYFADYACLFPMCAVGTNRLSVAAGVSLLPVPNPKWQLYYVAPKFTVLEKENLALAFGVLAATIPGFTTDYSEPNVVGIAYSVVTTGGPYASLTGGVGWGYSASGFTGFDLMDYPIAMVGGTRRLKGNLAFISENYLIPISGNLPTIAFTAGIRLFGEKLAVDFALGNAFYGERDYYSKSESYTLAFPFGALPYIDFAYHF